MAKAETKRRENPAGALTLLWPAQGEGLAESQDLVFEPSLFAGQSSAKLWDV